MGLIYKGLSLLFVLVNTQVLLAQDKQLIDKAEIPFTSGQAQMVLDATPADSTGKWYINDHCFIEDKKGRLHFFGINNPFFEDGTYNYTYHPHIGHAVMEDPAKGFKHTGMALSEYKEGQGFLGAPYVVQNKAGKYLMFFQSKFGDKRFMELAVSDDLYRWERNNKAVLYSHDNMRDPCLFEDDDGQVYFYIVTPKKEGSSISVIPTDDFNEFGEPTELIHIPDGVSWSGLESPYVIKRNGLYYLFVSYAHRHYHETLVIVSDRFDSFKIENTITTLHSHAPEIVAYKGKTYISSCGIEGHQMLDDHSLYWYELKWLKR
ncbi:family 43 glycosylhydrolase [Saccharicrinis sp. GN24d3]|uniref:family 43 glycosylhydrolase n=1 Tax=Saccharicrinis sp. GN24d3 TaxID=3458416 RepID=UPI0040371B83